ncbi:MAG: deoxyribonuclease V [Syntrophobacteraceae bacterium]
MEAPGPNGWDLSPKEARSLQEALAPQVKIQPLPEDFNILGAADIGYVKSADLLVAVVITFRWPGLEILETAHVTTPATFPYIPGLLSFREIPPLLQAVQYLERLPDVLLCDGQGIAHPRRFGLASHLGLCLGLPTVGCAKTRLCGEHEPLDLRFGNHTPLRLGDDVVGSVLCSRNNVKPLYVSPGHLSDLESSRATVLRCLRRYRIPEPLRQAHNLATHLRTKVAERAA